MNKILVIDDEIEKVRGVLEELLDGSELLYAENGHKGLAMLSDDVSAVLLDIKMPPTVGNDREREGIEVMAEIARRRPGLPVVMFTSHADVPLVLEAGRLGVFDYVVKMNEPGRLVSVIKKALASSSASSARTGRRDRFGTLVGSSERMQRLYEDIERVAPREMDVLLLGPTGSGKDLAAREIHAASRRAAGPFRVVNVAAIPVNLFESVLFGHAKGSFTGATSDKPGEFEAASGGTLFLDEIGTLATDVQVKLLRVLEEKCITRIGETKSRSVDTRVITATNANLLKEKDEGRFREDLYYRLRVATVMVPPLSDRRADVLQLADYFLDRTVKAEGLARIAFSEAARRVLVSHSWPGNVRELENSVKSAAVFARGAEIEPADLDLETNGSSITVHDLEGLYRDQKAGRTEITGPREFKTKYGEEALRYCMKKAVEETHDQAAAGILLGFLGEGHSEEQYNSFRQWFRRLGLTSRGILRGD
ncbi:MAG: sigma-54-dependent Fis family transcriptional regulator [Planctomycetes bacterium]|nr:sigma-54-dependent Fis family transcriptional regulator [Planctomycetota bacterium]